MLRRLFLTLAVIALAGVVLFADTQIQRPTGDGVEDDYSGFPTAADCAGSVDEAVSDDDTTYCGLAALNSSQLFTHTAFNITASSITTLRLFQHARVVTGGDNVTLNGRVRCNDGGTTPQGHNHLTDADAVTSTTYTTVDVSWTTNPCSGAAWTEAEIEGTGGEALLQMGSRITLNAAGEELRITQFWGEVDFVASAGGAPRRGLLFGVGDLFVRDLRPRHMRQRVIGDQVITYEIP